VHRRTLFVAVVSLALIGIGTVLVFLGGSLSPSERSLAGRYALQIPMPPTGTALHIDGKRARLLVVHTSGDSVFAFSVPLSNGKVPRPDGLAWSRFDDCLDFGVVPEPINLSPSSVIRCTGSKRQDDVPSDIDWDLSGRILTPGNRTSQLPRVQVEVTGQYVLIATWDRS
jgi:hypothetical protein